MDGRIQRAVAHAVPVTPECIWPRNDRALADCTRGVDLNAKYVLSHSGLLTSQQRNIIETENLRNVRLPTIVYMDSSADHHDLPPLDVDRLYTTLAGAASNEGYVEFLRKMSSGIENGYEEFLTLSTSLSDNDIDNDVIRALLVVMVWTCIVKDDAHAAFLQAARSGSISILGLHFDPVINSMMYTVCTQFYPADALRILKRICNYDLFLQKIDQCIKYKCIV